MPLTAQQVNFFNTFGFLHMPALFDKNETGRIIEEFELSITSFGDGKNHDGTKRTMFGGPIEHRPHLCGLLDDERITGLIGGVIGEDFNYASGDGNYYAGDTGWHPDGDWRQLFAVKVAFYLDPLTADTGCLRVIPGSQHPDHWLHDAAMDPNRSQELFGVAPRDFPGSIALETMPGDVVIFNHDLFHASFGGKGWRRMFTMNCTRHTESPEDMVTQRKYLSIHTPGAGNTYTGGGMYYPTMLDTANEKRMRHLAQCTEIHDELFPHLARKQG